MGWISSGPFVIPLSGSSLLKSGKAKSGMLLELFLLGECPVQRNCHAGLFSPSLILLITRCDTDGQLLKELLCAVVARK